MEDGVACYYILIRACEQWKPTPSRKGSRTWRMALQYSVGSSWTLTVSPSVESTIHERISPLAFLCFLGLPRTSRCSLS